MASEDILCATLLAFSIASSLASILRAVRMIIEPMRRSPEQTFALMLSWRFRRSFLAITAIQVLLSTTTGISFGILAFVKRGPWLLRTPTSAILLSILGQVRGRTT